MVVVMVSRPSPTLFSLSPSSSSCSVPPAPHCRLRLFPCFSSRRIRHPPYRYSFYSRCSLTNTEVFDTIVSEEEVHQEFSAAASNCAVPVIRCNPDVPDTESISLIAEGTYVDTILTTLPVLSEEEQNIIAATPAHPAGLYALYASCLAGNFVEQLWNFAWPAAIALLHPRLLPVAVLGFCSKVAVIAGGPLVGKLMDQFPRVPAYNCLTTIQTAAQLLSVGMIIQAHTASSTLQSSVVFRPWFVTLVLAGAVERLSGLTLGVAVERDWVVLLAGRNRPIALAEANAILGRIHLLSEIAGASLFGVLLSRYDTLTCLQLVASLMIWAMPVVVALTWLANMLSSGVLDRAKSPPLGLVDNLEISLGAIKHGWDEYMQQPVLPASLSYVLLSFNVVLAPGGLMTAFLTQHGLNPSVIGAFSGLCALVGIGATFWSARMVKQLGILKAGAAALILQASLLMVAVAVFWSGSLSQKTPLLFFLGLIVLSRIGHMSYDVIGTQILQTGTPPSKANLIGTTEIAIASLAESLLFGVAIVANDVSHFGLIALLSLLSVVGAAWLYCRWLSNPTDVQRSLFSF